ncbi:acetyltransferase [Dysgonomonas sp. HGC4]|uniref:acetyltransferase n=1 Tax=Dysgonomonas sp. HGC4 TaxID=1658009 RepID=UPI000A92EC72|nr:acetyltransferase [Dysgonomonas sp. HGC4]MBD8349073.1 acetyltransferase [Dysgonomonas sp. HGC4]
MIKKLILVGGGGHCKSVIDVAESNGYAILGILDTADNIGKKVLDYTIIGTDDDIIKYVEEVKFIVTVGQVKNVLLRMELHDRIITAGGSLATLVASSAYVSKYSSIEAGTVVLHQAMVNADAVIGKGCIINTYANIEHDAIIGDYTHISTGSMVNGACKVGSGVFLGSQSVLAQGVCIADNTIIGAGTFVNKNISDVGIYAGNPMRKFR